MCEYIRYSLALLCTNLNKTESVQGLVSVLAVPQTAIF